jgi:hypothetical protein
MINSEIYTIIPPAKKVKLSPQQAVEAWKVVRCALHWPAKHMNHGKTM